MIGFRAPDAIRDEIDAYAAAEAIPRAAAIRRIVEAGIRALAAGTKPGP